MIPIDRDSQMYSESISMTSVTDDKCVEYGIIGYKFLGLACVL